MPPLAHHHLWIIEIADPPREGLFSPKASGEKLVEREPRAKARSS